MFNQKYSVLRCMWFCENHALFLEKIYLIGSNVSIFENRKNLNHSTLLVQYLEYNSLWDVYEYEHWTASPSDQSQLEHMPDLIPVYSSWFHNHMCMQVYGLGDVAAHW